MFADLVGFTERSDRADPEDVRTTLLPFHARVKEDIERYGGHLDKFIGDAVMGVFGAPVAHEDDALRAVRAAMRIVRTIDELRERDPDLRVRVAVNTGEAVVAFGEGPQVGEAVAGDVVNTASRMQALAPPGGVVIGEATYRRVRNHVVAEAMPPARVKGKADPVAVWRVLGERDPSTVARISPVRFVGRDRELALLADLFDRTVADRKAHLVTISGEAGIGKSRLVEELRALVADRAAWLEGRSVPYGEAVTYSMLADVVRAAAGIGPTDEPAEVSRKLRAAALGSGIEERAVDAVVMPLEPALGLLRDDLETQVGPAEIGASVAALVGTGSRPIVLALHDLHWADEVVLEATAAAVRRLADSPVLVLATTRPELYDRDVRWPPAGAEATTVPLSALSPEQTEALVVSLIANAALAPDARASLLQRAAGNPLFALEYARMLADDVRRGDLAVPETIQALIAARIDAVADGARTLLHDAAVVGTEFWPALLAAVGSRAEEVVRQDLADLVARGLVRPTLSSLEGHEAFAFTHELIRDTAYGRIPRAERARRHLAVAEWLEAAAGERAGERAEALAQHFATAVELAEAARDRQLLDRARMPAAHWLVEAGRRALSADARRAFTLLEHAAAIADDGTRELATALMDSALAGRRGGTLAPAEVLDRYERAERIWRALEDPLGLGEVLVRMGSQLGAMARTAESRERLAEAIAVLEPVPPGRQLAAAYAHRAEEALFAGDVRSALSDAERTIEIFGGDTRDELAVMALHIRGDARCSLGDVGGLDDLRRALEISDAMQRPNDVVTSENYLAEWLWAFEGPTSGWPHYAQAERVAERNGNVSQGLWTKAARLQLLYELGRDDELLHVADEVLARGKERLDATVWVFAQAYRAEALVELGRADEAIDPAELLGHARAAEDVQAVAPALLAAAALALATGDRPTAVAHVLEFERVTRVAAREYREGILARASRVCVKLGLRDVLHDLVAQSEGIVPHHRCNLASARAALLELDGDLAGAREAYLDAAEAWERFGSAREAAFARAGAERCSAGA